jgi:hypothetical protein
MLHISVAAPACCPAAVCKLGGSQSVVQLPSARDAQWQQKGAAQTYAAQQRLVKGRQLLQGAEQQAVGAPGTRAGRNAGDSLKAV